MKKAEEIKKEAQQNFENSYNCAESILRAYLKVYDKDISLLSAATCFGGGVAGTGRMCGALSGALIALGLHFNRQKPKEKELYGKIRDKAQKIVKEFEKKTGSVNCSDHVKYDLTTVEGREKLHNDKEALEKCKSFIGLASRLLADELQE